MLQVIHLCHLPPTLPLYLTLYHSVQNAPFLRQQLLAGNTDFEYALVDASMIVSRTHILAACFRALNDFLNGRLKSRNVHSEIVFALSPSNNIGEAFRKFGIQDSTTNLLVIKVPTNPHAPTTTYESVEKHLKASVQGVAVDVNDETLSGMCDVEKVRKAYKIATPAAAAAAASKLNEEKAGLEQPEARSRSADEKQRLERAILGAMALRGAT